MTLFGNKVIAEIINLKEIILDQGGLLIQYNWSLIRRWPYEDSEAQGEPHGMMKGASGVPSSQGTPETAGTFPEVRNRTGRSLLKVSDWSMVLANVSILSFCSPEL